MNRCLKVAWAGLLLAGAAQAQGVGDTPAAARALPVLEHVRVTVLVDNMAGGGPLLGEWGLSYLIEIGQHQVLFDAGGGLTVLRNARARGKDLCKAEAIVLSHEHPDHTAGVDSVLNACGPRDVFVHPAGFDTRYAKGDSGAEPHRLSFTREELRLRGVRLVETTGPTAIREGLMVTGQIPRTNDFEDTGLNGYVFVDQRLTKPDSILDDQAIFFRVPEGVVVLLGCGHAGVINTLAYVSKLTGESRIYAIMGGTHLFGASPARMQHTIDALRQYGVQRIMLGHCTGVRAFGQLASAFPGQCSWPSAGTTVDFGAR